MMTVLQILQIHVEDPFVHYMKINGEPDAVCMNAVIKRLQEHKHVSSIKESGTNMFKIILVKAFKELEECCKDLVKVCLGNQLHMLIHNLMMNLLLVRATPSKIPKRALCGLYKNSGLDEMRLMG